MSLDYPNRADWLAIRRKATQPINYLHVSAKLVTIFNPITNQPKTVVARGVTYNVGRNAAKRLARLSN